MNTACRRKDCILIEKCASAYDLADCRAYRNTGEVPRGLCAIWPLDRQGALIPRNAEFVAPVQPRMGVRR